MYLIKSKSKLIVFSLIRWGYISTSQCPWYHQESFCISWQPHGSKQQRVVTGCAGGQLQALWPSALKHCLNVGYKYFAVPCLVWVTSTSMSSSCAISPAIYQKGQHQLRWSQVLWLHYHINNPSDYKWSVVAASDIAATAHCKEEEKKVDFSITEKFQPPRHLRALRKYKWCCDGTAINQFTQSNGQHKWKRNQHSVWPGDLSQTELSTFSFKRYMYHEGTLLSEQHTHWQQSKSGCVSCSSQVSPPRVEIPAWRALVHQSSLFPSFPWIWPIFYLISSVTFVFPTLSSFNSLDSSRP